MDERGRKPRLSIEVDPALRRRLKVVAAQHEVTIRDYVLTAVERALDAEERGDWSQLSEPSLARDWDTESDGVCDHL